MIAATTHTGEAIQKLIEMLSESTVFQVGTGQTAAAGAADFIFCPEKRNETEDQQADQAPTAFAVITLPEGSMETELAHGGGGNGFTLHGSLELQFIRQMDSANCKRDELTAFLNFSEGAWLHLIANAAVDDQLAIKNAPRQGLYESNDKSVSGFAVQKPFHKSVYLIEWGPGV